MTKLNVKKVRALLKKTSPKFKQYSSRKTTNGKDFADAFEALRRVKKAKKEAE